MPRSSSKTDQNKLCILFGVMKREAKKSCGGSDDDDSGKEQ